MAAHAPRGNPARTEVVSPTNGEQLLIAGEDFPDYEAWRPIGAYDLEGNAPVAGSTGIGFESGRQLVFEVFIEFHGPYLHALVYYRDGITPRLFVKQGVGGIFHKEPIDAIWTPARLFPAFRDRTS